MFTKKFRYAFAFLLSVFTYVNTKFCKVYHYFNIPIKGYYAFSTILVIPFLIMEANRLADPATRKLENADKSETQSIVFFFITGSLFATIITIFIVAITGIFLHDFSARLNITAFNLILMYAWLVNLIFHLVNAILYYFQEYKNSHIEAEKLKRNAARAQLQLIRSRINPHFLFNNLNVLSALVMKENTKAHRCIEAFSKFYRYMLTNHNKNMVALKKELDYMKPYIFLLKKRFGEGLQVALQTPLYCMEHFIIPASIQMQIENALKPNIVSKNKPLQIDIHATGNGTIVVSNNLKLKSPAATTTAFGLRNIIKWYELVTNKAVLIKKNEAFFSVSVPFLPQFENYSYYTR